MYRYPILDNIDDGEEIAIKRLSRTPENIHHYMQGKPHTYEFMVLSQV